MQKANVCILGAGSLGCYFATQLGSQGAAVTLIRRPRKRGLLLEKGTVRLNQLNSTTTKEVPVQVAYGIPGLLLLSKPCDIVLVTVKHKDTRDVGRMISAGLEADIFNHDTALVSLQNGMGNLETLLEETASTGKQVNLFPGLTFLGSSMVAPLHAQHNGYGKTYFGVPKDMEKHTAVKHLESISPILSINDASEVSLLDSSRMNSMIWTKLLVNTVINPLTAILNLKNGCVAEEHIRGIRRSAAEEFAKLAAAEDISLNLNGATPDEFVHNVAVLTENNVSSMLSDVRAGNETEIEALNGYVVRRAKEKHGLSLPVQESLYCMVKAL